MVEIVTGDKTQADRSCCYIMGYYTESPDEAPREGKRIKGAAAA